MKLSSTLVGSLLIVSTLMLAAPQTEAQVTRISAKIVDPAGKPVAGATLTVTSQDSDSFEMVETSNKKGKVTLTFANSEWRYVLLIQKDGFQNRTEHLSFSSPGNVKAEWILLPGDAVPAPNAVQIYNEGVKAQQGGDLDLAAEKYREAAEANPEMVEPRTALAVVALLQEDYATVAAESEAALEINPTDARALQLRFDGYRLAGDQAKTDEAAAALRETGLLEDAVARIFNEGVDAYRAGKKRDAIAKFEQVVRFDPEMTQAYLALARLYLATGNPAEVAKNATAVLEREPDNADAWKLAYDGGRMSGDADLAAKALDRLVELDPEWIATALFEHAEKLFDTSQHEQAAAELEYVVKVRPDLARAQFLLGAALFNTGRAAEGREHLRTFIELAPGDPDAEVAHGLLEFEN